MESYNPPKAMYSFHEQPKVTVIIPVYKVERYLAECLNSIVNQTMEELEIIIVDEGDMDRCREIIDSFAAKDPRIVAPHEKHGGYGASCNYGIRMARGEYLAIVESDDLIEPEMYEEMYEYAKRLDADVVKTPYCEYNERGERHDCYYRQLMRETTPQNQCFSVKEFGELLQVHASLWSGIYRTSYMRENNIFFVEAKGGAYVDVGFRIHTLIHTDKIAWLDKPYYNYRISNEESTTNQFKLAPMLKRWEEMHRFFEDKKEDYDRFYGPYLVQDEYANTLEQAYVIEIAPEEWDMMRQNFSHVKEQMIEATPALRKHQKEELLFFKRHPEEAKKIWRRIKWQGDRDMYARLPVDGRYTFPWQETLPGERIVLCGGGVVGKTFLRQTLTIPYCYIVAICDKYPERTDINPNRVERKRINVFTPKEFFKWETSRYDKIILAAEQESLAKEMREELVAGGIPKEKIVWVDPLVHREFLTDV